MMTKRKIKIDDEIDRDPKTSINRRPERPNEEIKKKGETGRDTKSEIDGLTNSNIKINRCQTDRDSNKEDKLMIRQTQTPVKR